MTIETLAVLLGLVVSVIAIVKPIIKLTKTMAELTLSVQTLKDSFNNIIVKNHDAHARLWDHNKRQDEVINNHDKRITKIETKLNINEPERTDIHTNMISSDEGLLDD